MAVFRKDEQGNSDRLDWSILQDSWISRYWQISILEEDLMWFEKENYRVVDFDCKTWDDSRVMHAQLKLKLTFPDYYGENLDALRDCLSELSINERGLVLVFRHMDTINKQTARVILDIVADTSRRHMLFGDRMITLAQFDQQDYEVDSVGLYTRCMEWKRMVGP